MNIKSKLINQSELARRMNLRPGVFDNKLKARGYNKPFTPAEIEQMEGIIREDIFDEKIPLENINPETY